VTDHHRHHIAAHHQLQQPPHQLHPTSQYQSIRSLQCYDEQRQVHAAQQQQRQQQQQPDTGDADRAVAPSSVDPLTLQPRVGGGGGGGAEAVLRHGAGGHQLEQYGKTKPIKSEPSETALAAAAAVVSAAGSRESAEPRTAGTGGDVGGGGGRAGAVGGRSTDSAVVSCTPSSSSSALNDVISRHHQHQGVEMTSGGGGGCSFTVSSLVHPTTGNGGGIGAGGFASVVDGTGLQSRDVAVDGVPSTVVDAADSSCFDPSTAAAAAHWFAHHPGSGGGYSSRRTPELYMQRLHAASISAGRRLSDAADVDGSVPAFGVQHGAGYSAWYGGACTTTQSPTDIAYLGAPGEVFDAASRMLSGRQSCAHLQAASPFRAYYYGSAINAAGPPAYAAYADDCVATAKY